MKNNAEGSWIRLVEADRTFRSALRDFLNTERESRISILKSGLSSARPFTLSVLERIPVEDLKELLPDLLYLARAIHGYLWHVRKLILSLPKEWLLQHIEAATEPILGSGDLEYRELLELYKQIDRQLARRLAARVAASDDPEIRRIGDEFLAELA